MIRSVEPQAHISGRATVLCVNCKSKQICNIYAMLELYRSLLLITCLFEGLVDEMDPKATEK